MWDKEADPSVKLLIEALTQVGRAEVSDGVLRGERDLAQKALDECYEFARDLGRVIAIDRTCDCLGSLHHALRVRVLELLHAENELAEAKERDGFEKGDPGFSKGCIFGLLRALEHVGSERRKILGSDQHSTPEQLALLDRFDALILLLEKDVAVEERKAKEVEDENNG